MSIVHDTSTTAKNAAVEEDRAGCCSSMLYLWLSPLFALAARKTSEHNAIDQDDLCGLPACDHGALLNDKFQQSWDKYALLANKKFNLQDGYTLNLANPDAPDEQPPDLAKGCCASFCRCCSRCCGRAYRMYMCDCKSKPAPKPMSRAKQARMWLLKKSSFGVLGPEVWRTAGIIKLFNSTSQFCFPICLSGIVAFIQGRYNDHPNSTAIGILLCFGLFFAMCAKAVLENRYFHLVVRGGWQLRSALSTAIYSKSLRLTAASRQSKTLGEIVNLMQIDASKMENFTTQLHVIWDGAYQICGYICILLFFIGWPALVGVVFMIIAMPVQKEIMTRLYMRNRAMVKDTDSRVKITNELLQGIQCVKMYSWEDSFIKVIEGFRGEEMISLKKVAYLRAFSRAYMYMVPAVVSLLSLSTYALNGGDINPYIIFAALSAFNQLRFPLMFYPMTLAAYATMKVAQSRIADYLSMQELPKEMLLENHAEGKENVMVSMKDVSVSWGTHASTKKKTGALAIAAAKAASLKDQEEKKKINKPSMPTVVLEHLTIDIHRGQCIAIVGPVGSGKSAFCNTILREMKKTEGTLSVHGTIAYAAQTAWILNASIKDNILFGQSYDRKRYRKILDACQLRHDLDVLDDGEETMIGERGINLSGGQKQRVSVARAAYSNKDVIILDDPMSALDPEVGHRLFDQCIRGVLREKTVILVTHSMDILTDVDRIIVLDVANKKEGDGNGEEAGEQKGAEDKDDMHLVGYVREEGTYQELVSAGLDFAKMLGKEGADEPEVQSAVPDGGNTNSSTDATNASDANATSSKNIALTTTTPTTTPTPTQGEQNKTKMVRAASVDSNTSSNGTGKGKPKSLMQKEEREKGAVNSKVYWAYMQAGGGICRFTLLLFWYVAHCLLTILNTAWVAIWTADSQYKRNSLFYYLGGLLVVALLLSVISFIRTASMALVNIGASDRLHGGALRSILHAPTSFYDVTPIGRIISRFSKDLHMMDNELGNYMDFFFWCSLYVFSTMCVIIYATPWFAVALVPISAVYFMTVNYFRSVNREAKRLESIARSPVYAHFSETLGGLTTIRAFDDSARFVTTNMRLVDQSIRAFYVMKSSDRWLSVRLELIGAVIALCAALMAVVQTILNPLTVSTGQALLTSNATFSPSSSSSGEVNNDEFASMAGLSLSFAIGVTGLLNWTVRSFAQMEAGINSTERILHYTHNIPQEDLNGDDEKALVAKKQDLKDWPKNGHIVVKNMKMRYRKTTELVLKGVNFEIQSGQRVGVVGRTGAGKSSLMLCLLRLVEPELDENNGKGPIEWDGVDTSSLNLHTLRTKIGIIPQTPTLFSGTIRSNLDPFGERTDEEL